MIKDIKLFTKENSMIFDKILSELNQNDKPSLSDIKVDVQLIDKIFNFASIKYILEKKKLSEENIVEMLNEINRDLKNFELEIRIEELESKFSKDFSENTFNELKELKKLQKTN